MINILGYQITEELYESANTLVYRGQRSWVERSERLEAFRSNVFGYPVRPSYWFRIDASVIEKVFATGRMEKWGAGALGEWSKNPQCSNTPTLQYLANIRDIHGFKKRK